LAFEFDATTHGVAVSLPIVKLSVIVAENEKLMRMKTILIETRTRLPAPPLVRRPQAEAPRRPGSAPL
jgi:hypothetical protein